MHQRRQLYIYIYIKHSIFVINCFLPLILEAASRLPPCVVTVVCSTLIVISFLYLITGHIERLGIFATLSATINEVLVVFIFRLTIVFLYCSKY